jgi:hypothetical protein
VDIWYKPLPNQSVGVVMFDRGGAGGAVTLALSDIPGIHHGYTSGDTDTSNSNSSSISCAMRDVWAKASSTITGSMQVGGALWAVLSGLLIQY